MPNSRYQILFIVIPAFLSTTSLSAEPPVTAISLFEIDTQYAVASVAFSPDGKLLACGSGWKVFGRNQEFGKIKVIDSFTGQSVLDFEDSHMVGSVLFSRNNSLFASAGEHGVRLWDTRSWKQTRLIPASVIYHAIDLSADAKVLATSDSLIELWDTATGKRIRSSTFDDGAFYSLRFSPDGKTLATGGTEGDIQLWDYAKWKLIRKWKAHKLEVRAIEFSPDGKRLCSGSFGGQIRLWNVSTGKSIQTIKERVKGEPIFSLAFSQDGRTLASGCGYSILHLWDVSNGDQILKLQPTEIGDKISVAITPDGKKLACGYNRRKAHLWVLKQQKPKKEETNKSDD